MKIPFAQVNSFWQKACEKAMVDSPPENVDYTFFGLKLSLLAIQLIEAFTIMVGAIIVAAVLRRVLGKIADRFDRSEDDLVDDVLRSVRLPVWLLVLNAGLYFALSQLSAPISGDIVIQRYVHEYASWFRAVASLSVIIGLVRFVHLGVTWYGMKMQQETGVPSSLGIIRKAGILAVWVLGLVQILSVLGVKVTSLIASLGIAGLAVGLALQDTIANLFAGFYLVGDRSIRAGDYIKLDSGEEGFVESVGWRNTRIRLWANNLVLVPNQKLISSTMTNMTLPNPVLSVYTYCGVGYDSDLQKVEDVTLEVANQIIRQFDGADLTYEPIVRYKEFGDSNINFLVIFRATEVGAQYILQHEFIKALHKRFKDEDIEISFPVRKLVWESGPKFPIDVSGKMDE